MTPAAARVLQALGPALRGMAGPMLTPLVEAYADPLDDVDQRARITAGGWAAMFDVDATPDPAWIGAAIGSPVPPGSTVEQARAYVKDRPYWRRGTPAAITAAVADLLVGPKRVRLIERDGSPWRLTVLVFTSELAPGVTLDDLRAAVATQKPVGIIATVQLVGGPTIAHTKAEHGPTITAERVTFPRLGDVITHTPEEGTIP